MSRGRKSHRPDGHPARVAARRERSAGRRAQRVPLGEPAPRIMRVAGDLSAALEAELWCSSLLGALWQRRFELPPQDAQNYAHIYGGPVVEELARVGGSDALVALRVIQNVDHGPLGMKAGELAKRLSDRADGLPAWLDGVGNARIERAAGMHEEVFDDGFTLLIEARHPDADTHAVGVYLDNNLGVLAKDILLAESIDDVERIVRERFPEGGQVMFEPIAPGVAAGQVHAAIKLTDMTVDPPVAQDHARLRALALLRADETPHYRSAPQRPEHTLPERD